MARGIRDKVAILGMGCTRFGERWESDAADLMVEAYVEAMADAGIDRTQLDAAWLAVGFEATSIGPSSIPLSIALRLPNIPVTKVENYCASGTEAFRGAVYAVASGAADIALALGVEKLKDTGYGGLPVRSRGLVYDMMSNGGTAPGNFAQLAAGYRARHRLDAGDLKRAIGHVSVKSHANGAKNPRAHLRKAVDIDTVLNAPMVAEPLGLYDCCGVSDGAACAIVTTPEIARSLGKTDLVSVKALQLAVTDGWELQGDGWDGGYVNTTRQAASRAYQEGGIRDPRGEISMMEVHDCFSITELVTMEDLGVSAEGRAIHDVRDGFYDADGGIPCQIDGGLKCFGHPIGASGLRMVYEMYLQLLGRAGERQLKDPRIGLTHNLGGMPSQSVCAVTIVGRHGE
ncbi:MAG: acetyl-CoA acetyltransferase [Rhizobiaceae bacterium]|nr:acetyl-CoA acetyltransferase [Rhizobiaceae bacterium]